MGFLGQLGNGTPSASTPTPSAVDRGYVNGAPAFVSIESGGQFACGIVGGGKVVCWGNGSYGKLGNGGAGNVTVPTPVDLTNVSSNKAFVEVVTGESHACARTDSGSVYCWGDATEGQLGIGTNSAMNVPTLIDVTSVAAPKAVIGLSTKGSLTCALISDGRAFCWGPDYYEQLGNGQGTTSSNVPTQVAATTPFTQIAAATDHACALTSDGDTYCWGSVQSGGIGNGSNTGQPKNVPAAILTTSLPSNDTSFKALIPGGDSTCGITAAGLSFCWGSDNFGVLGNGGGNSNALAPSATLMTSVGGRAQVVATTVGYNNGCLLNAAGKPHCWGLDSFGTVGNGDPLADVMAPVAVTVTSITSSQTFRTMSVGIANACGINGDGLGFCWGEGFAGAIGNGSSANASAPAPVNMSGL